MASKLIRLNDGTLVEVEIEPVPGQVQQISGGSAATRVESSFKDIAPVLFKVCSSVLDTWEEHDQDGRLEQVEVEVGLSFEGEGNIYVTKAKAGATLKVKMILKPSTSKKSQ
jgi:Trypsin-co-occurring domain 1